MPKLTEGISCVSPIEGLLIASAGNSVRLSTYERWLLHCFLDGKGVFDEGLKAVTSA